MREILFKGKRLDTGDLVEGYLFCVLEETFICWGTTNGTPDMIKVDPSTVGQYTGLPDKNGKLMFEGDLVIIGGHKDTPAQIAFDDFGWTCLIPEFPYYRHRLENDSKKYEVTGNIHDRSEEEN